MATDELNEYLERSELLPTQQARVREASERNRDKTFQEIIFYHRLGKATQAVGELQNYTVAHGLFLPPELKAQFQEMHPLLWSALTRVRIGKEAEDHKMQTQAWEELQAKAEPIYKAIEASISERLHSHSRGQIDA